MSLVIATTNKLKEQPAFWLMAPERGTAVETLSTLTSVALQQEIITPDDEQRLMRIVAHQEGSTIASITNRLRDPFTGTLETLGALDASERSAAFPQEAEAVEAALDSLTYITHQGLYAQLNNDGEATWEAVDISDWEDDHAVQNALTALKANGVNDLVGAYGLKLEWTEDAYAPPQLLTPWEEPASEGEPARAQLYPLLGQTNDDGAFIIAFDGRPSAQA